MADGTVGLFTMGGDASLREDASVRSSGPGATYLVATSHDVLARVVGSTIELWRLGDSPSRISTVPAPAPVSALAVSADQLVAASGTTVARWDIHTLQTPVPLEPITFGAPVTALAAGGTSHRFAGGDHDGSVTVWSSDDPQFRAQSGGTTGLTALSFGPDGTTLAGGTQSGLVVRWQLTPDATSPETTPSETTPPETTLSPLPALDGLTGEISAVAVSDSRIAASVGTQTRVWKTGIVETTLPAPTAVTSIAFTAGGATLVTGGESGQTQAWPLPAPVAAMPDSIDAHLATTDNGTKILEAGSVNSTIDASKPVNPVAGPPLPVPDGEIATNAIATSADGAYAAIGTQSGKAVLYKRDAQKVWQLVSIVPLFDDPVGNVAVSRTGKYLIAASAKTNKVTVWGVADGTTLSTFDVAGGTASDIAYDPHFNRLVVASPNSVVVYALEDAKHPRKVSSPPLAFTPTAVAVSPNGRYFAVGSPGREVLLFDTSSGDLVGRMSAPADGVSSVAFSPDSKYVVAGGRTEFVWVWDVTSPSSPVRYATLRAYAGPVSDAAFVGSDYLAAAVDHIGVVFWHFNAADAAAELCARGTSPVSEEEWRTHLPGVPLIENCSA